MKKFYTVIALAIASFCPAVLSAQSSLVMSNVHISGDPLFLMEGHATIRNNSNQTLDVLVERKVNIVWPGHSSYFCWVQCYGSGTSLSPDPVTLAPNDTTDIFRGDLETNAIPGIDTIAYCFFVQGNPADSVCVTYRFDSTVGIGEVPSNRNYVSKAYPNPASTSTSFYVNVLKSGKSAQLKFFNMLGTEVKNIDVNETRGSVKVNVSDLKSGIYFYSLWVDGKSTGTGKLMVTR